MGENGPVRQLTRGQAGLVGKVTCDQKASLAGKGGQEEINHIHPNSRTERIVKIHMSTVAVRMTAEKSLRW